MNPPQPFRLGRLLAIASVVVVLAYGCAAQEPCPSPDTTHASAAPLGYSPASICFNEHDIGTSSYVQSVTVKNNDAKDLYLDVVIARNDVEFAIAKVSKTVLKHGEESLIDLKFTPIDAGKRTGELRVNYQLKDSTTATTVANQLIELTGTGAIPKLRLSQQSLDFGSQVVGSTSLVRTVILTAGQETVNQIVANTSGDFTVTPVTCEPLPPSSSCALAVTFVPKSAGKIVGSLTIFNSQTAPKVLQLTGVGLQSCNAGPDFWSKEEFFSLLPVLLIIGFYLAGVLLVRWNMIARPSRHLVKAEIAAVRQRVEALPPQSNASTGVASIRELLDRAQDLVSDAQASKGWDYFFWTRGHELAAWSFIHEAEEQLVYFLPEQSVRAELERAESDLRDAGTTTAVALADRIHEALAAVPVLPLDDPTRKTLEAVLQAFQSQRINIENEVNAAFAPGVTIQIAQWRALAQRVLGFITPQTASLADQIRRALNDPASWEEDWRQLLERAADLLESDAAKLAATLKEFCAADGVSLPEPTEDEWKAALEKAREFFTPHASLVNQIQTTLAAKPLGPVDRWRALHSEALSYLYDRSDTQFAQLVSWQNKTVWLVGISVLLIVSLAATLQHGMLFLVGATGGLLSRLTRSLSRQDVPTDYGASWSTLFLSPVIGALAGWSGILLIIVGVEFNILGSALKFDWCNSFNPVMLGIALLLGTSERFFDKILSKLDEKLGETPSPPQAPPAPPPTPPAPPALPAVTPSVLPEGKVGQAYSQPVTASGGTPPYQWSVASGQLPSGLTLDPTGQISGTPATPESAKFSLQVTDVAAAKSLPVEFSLVIT